MIYFICFITTRLLSAIEKGGLGEDNCFFFCSVTEASAECIMEASILGSEVFSRNENTRAKVKLKGTESCTIRMKDIN